MLETQERQKLEETAHTRTAAYRAVQRARLILLAAEGMANTAIAREVGLSRATVVLWRQRFDKSRLEGLQDAPRPGQKPKYDKNTEHPKGIAGFIVFSSRLGIPYATAKGAMPVPSIIGLARRRGKMRAAVAAGHHLARAMYHVLNEGKSYEDRGADYFDRRNTDTLKAHLIGWLQGLGYRVDLTPEAAVA